MLTRRTRSPRWEKLIDLEVAQQTVKGREYAVLVIAEQDLETITEEDFVQSLPHFNGHERTEIYKHFLGCTTWEKACHALGVDYTALPDKTLDSLKRSIT